MVKFRLLGAYIYIQATNTLGERIYGYIIYDHITQTRKEMRI